MPTYLVVDIQPRLTLYRTHDGGRIVVGAVDVPPSFGVTQTVAVSDSRVIVVLVNSSPSLKYRVDLVDFARPSVATLTSGDGPPPRLAVLSGERLLVSRLGDTVVTPVSTWQPTRVGPQSALGIDARGDRVLYVVGEHPQYTKYQIESEAGANVATISGPEISVDTAARLDMAQPAVFFMRPRSPELTTLWRADPSGVGPVADLPGTHLGFGLSERYVAFVGKSGPSVLVEVVGGALVRKRFELARGEPTAAAVIFAGASFGVSLRLGDGWRTYLVNAVRDHVADVGAGRVIGAAFSCGES